MTPATGYPVKLVRDRIGERLGGDGTVTYEPVGDRETHVKFLRRKLVEEVFEYIDEPSVSELADVLEAVMALARKAHPSEDIFAVAAHKNHERGSFQRGVLMVAHHATDGQRRA